MLENPVSASDLMQQWRLVEYEEIGSTNSEAHRLAAAGERGPLWIAARRQTDGRGRLGRSWQSLDGNLAATLLFKPECAPAVLHQLSFVAAVAVHDAIAGYADTAAGETLPRLKWPNDVLIGGAKVGGILTESTSFGPDLVAIVGIGINIAAAPDILGRITGHLDYRRRPSPQELHFAIATGIEQWLATWRHGAGFQAVRVAWRERTGPVGEPLSVTVDGTRQQGLFCDIDVDGALLLKLPTGEIRRYSAGDVSLGGEETI